MGRINFLRGGAKETDFSKEFSMNTANKSAAIRVRSAVKAGGFQSNHNSSLKTAGIRVRSTVKAGGFQSNHNSSVRVAR